VKLAAAVKLYVDRRRSEGAPFISSATILQCLCKFCGDIDLRKLTEDDIERFIYVRKCAASTRISNFSAVKCFVEYYGARGKIALSPLRKPAAQRKIRLPYIYTKGQLHALLEAARKLDFKRNSLEGETLRMILLMLYATGATIQQVLSLRRCCLNLNHLYIEFERKGGSRNRLPIGAELAKELCKYLHTNEGSNNRNELLFCGKAGKAITRGTLWFNFVKVHKIACLAKSNACHSPRLQDLRFTFAVHRLSSCIQRGEKLDRLIPALSSYLGYSSLTKAEQYLAYVPERFTKDLRKLSPTQGARSWHDEPSLLCSLGSL